MKKFLLFIFVIVIALMVQSCLFSNKRSSEANSIQFEADFNQSETNFKHCTVEELNANKKQFIDDFEITMTNADRGIKIDDISFDTTEVLSDLNYPQFICTIKGSEWHTDYLNKTSLKPFEVKMFIEDRNGKIEWDEFTLKRKIW